MRFLCLICAERVIEHIPAAEAEQQLQRYAGFVQEIVRDGNFIGGNRLLPPATAKTVRVRDGRMSVTDGPWAETKELLGGYYLIDAPDMEAALLIAAKIPGAVVGCVEVRAVAEDLPTLVAVGQATSPSR